MILAVDIESGGFGYNTPPQIQIIDPCDTGAGAVIEAEIENGSVSDVIVVDGGSGYNPPPAVGPQYPCLLYTSPSPRDATLSRMPSSA